MNMQKGQKVECKKCGKKYFCMTREKLKCSNCSEEIKVKKKEEEKTIFIEDHFDEEFIDEDWGEIEEINRR